MSGANFMDTLFTLAHVCLWVSHECLVCARGCPTAPQGQSTVLNRKAARTKGCEMNLDAHGAMYGEVTHLVRKSTPHSRLYAPFWTIFPPCAQKLSMYPYESNSTHTIMADDKFGLVR